MSENTLNPNLEPNLNPNLELNLETGSLSPSSPDSQRLFRCGTIAIIGRPNVGKSSLMNCLIQQKVSIISHKPQTTRHQIRGILTSDKCQFIFVDTPGLHFMQKNMQSRKQLNQYMNDAAMAALLGIDVVLFLLEAGRWTEEDERIAKLIQQHMLQQSDLKLIVGLNKMDYLSNPNKLLPVISELNQRLKQYAIETDIVPISALKQINIPNLLEVIQNNLPHHSPMYSEDTLTDKDERFLTSEIIREKLTRQLNQELPYGITVLIDQFVESTGFVSIQASIIIERKSQKSIVIGANGSCIKRIRQQAQGDIKKLLQRNVYLKLWVKVRENWADDEQFVTQLNQNHPL